MTFISGAHLLFSKAIPVIEVDDVFLRRRKRLAVDLDGLETDHRALLSDFLRSSLSVDIVLSGGKVFVDSGRVSSEELRRLVNKFVYHRNLNRRFWVALDGDTVRIHLFEKAKKRERRKRETTPPRTVTHGW